MPYRPVNMLPHHFFCDDGYMTNLPLADVRDGKAWIAYEYDSRTRRDKVRALSPARPT